MTDTPAPIDDPHDGPAAMGSAVDATAQSTDTTAQTDATAHSADAAPRRVPRWACPLIGVGAAAVGLLPWLVTGMRLPLQNLWATEPPPEGMPIAMLPFSQYLLTLIFGLLVVGAAVAGIAARATQPRLPRGGFSLIVLGVLGVQIIAIVQSTLVVRDGLQERTAAAFYLGGLVAVCVVSFLAGLVTLLLIARAPRAGALLGLTIGAIAVWPWTAGFFQPLLVTASEGLLVFISLIPWLTPVLVGVAIAWAGVGTVGRVIAALVSLALLWVAPAAMTGISYAAGSRVLAHDPVAMIDAGVDVFTMALLTPEIALRPIVAAVVVAVIGLIVRGIVTRRATTPRGSRTPTE